MSRRPAAGKRPGAERFADAFALRVEPGTDLASRRIDERGKHSSQTVLIAHHAK